MVSDTGLGDGAPSGSRASAAAVDRDWLPVDDDLVCSVGQLGLANRISLAIRPAAA
jgi:hypothetical protein